MTTRTSAWLKSVVLLLIILLAGVLASCSSSSNGVNNESLRIYEMIAGKGGFVAVSGDTTGNRFQLTLTGVPGNVLYFTDRPAQEAGYDTVANVMNNIWPRVYGSVAPNVLLQATVENQATIDLFCMLENPAYNAATGQLSFTLTYLNGNQKPVNNLNVTDVKLIILNNATSAQLEEWSQLMEGVVAIFSDPAADGTVSITLQQPEGTVFSYTSAPGRKSAIITLKDYIKSWQARFNSSQPNISVAYNFQSGQTAGVQIVSVTKTPVYDETAGTITFTAKILYGTTPVGTGGLKVTVPSLFIDGGSPTYSDADLQKLKTTNSCANCTLEEAPLDSLSLRNADLSGANLKKAILSNTDLTGANLQNADLTGANITGAKLANADTSNTIMTEGVKGRLITLVNNCSSQIAVGAYGNSEKTRTGGDTCASNDQCGVNQYCLNSVNQCQFVPVPILQGDVVSPAKACTSNADCCSGSACSQFCYITVPGNGQCAKVPAADRGNYWQMSPSTSQTILIPNRWGGRFWPRTGCNLQGSVCPEVWTGDVKNCNDAAGKIGIDRTLTTTCHYEQATCNDANPCSNGTCDKNTPSFTRAPPTSDECKIDADCTAIMPGDTLWSCISRTTSVAGKDVKVNQCGYYQCKTCKCSDSNQCNPKQFLCETGQCLGTDNKTPSANCRVGGKDPVTKAEVNLYPFADSSNDFYDISMVDGANLAVSIAPSPKSYTLQTDSFILPNRTCSTDDDCKLTGNTTKAYVCKDKKCVNRFACGSPGCVSDCKDYGFGLTLASTWGGSDFAMPYSQCPAELRLLMTGGKITDVDTAVNYKGCLSPTAVCADKSLNVKGFMTLKCDSASLKYLDLYGCTGDYKTSCYGGTGENVCGCPGWSLDEQCTGSSPVWVTNALPYYTKFHTMSPASYTYAYDDKGATFQCKSKNETVQVNYTITFCPK